MESARIQFDSLWEEPKTVTSAGDIAVESMREIYRYWVGLKQRAGRPRCCDFDVLDIPRHLLPHIYYLEYVPDKDDFLQRVLGTQIEHNTGIHMTGRFVSDVNAITGANLVQTLRFVLETGQPCLSRCPYYGLHRYGRSVHRIGLPLFEDDRVRFVFGVSVFEFDRMGSVDGHRGLTSFHRTS